MSTATIITILIIIAVAIGAVAWVYLVLFKRAKKAYWDLYLKIVQAEQHIGQQIGQMQEQIGQMQKQMGQVQQQAAQIQHHLLLEHMGNMANQIKETGDIDSKSLTKILEFLHESKMDNLSGKDAS